MYYYHPQQSVDDFYSPAISTRNFFFGRGGGGGGGSDLNVLRTYIDTLHASDKRLIAKIGLELVRSLLP